MDGSIAIDVTNNSENVVVRDLSQRRSGPLLPKKYSAGYVWPLCLAIISVWRFSLKLDLRYSRRLRKTLLISRLGSLSRRGFSLPIDGAVVLINNGLLALSLSATADSRSVNARGTSAHPPRGDDRPTPRFLNRTQTLTTGLIHIIERDC